MPDVFAVPVFFIVFREAIETSVIVAVLLAFINQTLGGDEYKSTSKALVRQVWLGLAAGLFLCLVIGGGLIGTFYKEGKNLWQGAENLYEGIFNLLACIIITVRTL